MMVEPMCWLASGGIELVAACKPANCQATTTTRISISYDVKNETEVEMVTENGKFRVLE